MRESALRLGIELASTFSDEDVSAIRLIGHEDELQAGRVLATQDEPATHIHILLSGVVKTYQTNAAGQETVFRIHTSGSIIGLSTLTSSQRWDATSVAMQPCRTIVVASPAFVTLLETRPDLGLKLLHLLVDRLSDMHYRIGEFLHQTVEQRMAQLLLALSRPASKRASASVLLTHEELAQMIHSRRQTVTSTLSKFSRLGYVETAQRSLRILDREGLMGLL